MNSVFQCDSCRDYLQAWLDGQPAGGHGKRGALAEAGGMHSSFFSQVLKGKAWLSLEQGYRLADYLQLPEAESRYFLLLLQRERAGDTGLEKFLSRQLIELKKENLDRRKKSKLPGPPVEVNKQVYFSSWLYSAVHLLCQIPAFKTAEALAEHLRVDRAAVARALKFLEESGLIRPGPQSYVSGETQFYLEKESPYLPSHQVNWRIKACEGIQVRRPGMHFTAAVTISEKDRPKVQEILDRAVQDCLKIAATSKEEDLFALQIDFFRP